MYNKYKIQNKITGTCKIELVYYGNHVLGSLVEVVNVVTFLNLFKSYWSLDAPTV